MATKQQPVQPETIIYTPNETAAIGSDYLREKKANKGGGVPLYLPSVDADFIPAMAGEVITILGRPGSGKTGFMMRWARERAKRLALAQTLNRVVAYATWEQSIEELYAFNVAADKQMNITSMARGEISDAEWQKVLAHSVQHIRLPLWFLGHSLARRKSRPHITIELLDQALQKIEAWNDERMQVDMVFIDYLQRIPLERGVESKTIGMSDTLDRLKDLALQCGCPVVVGVQARREVDARDLQVPQMDDGQWTSNVEQTSDKIFSVVRPRKYRLEGEKFGKMTVQGNNQMLISLLKQKLGKDNQTYWAYFDPAYNKLDELETKKYDQSVDEDDEE